MVHRHCISHDLRRQTKEKIMVGQKGSTHFESAEVAAVNHLHNACIDEEDYYTTTSDLSAAAVVRESGACVVLGSGGNRGLRLQTDCAKMEAIPEQLREFTMTRLREINLPLHRIPFQEKWVPPELPYFIRMTMGRRRIWRIRRIKDQ